MSQMLCNHWQYCVASVSLPVGRKEGLLWMVRGNSMCDAARTYTVCTHQHYLFSFQCGELCYWECEGSVRGGERSMRGGERSVRGV